jgi:hypothetical protein
MSIVIAGIIGVYLGWKWSPISNLANSFKNWWNSPPVDKGIDL